MTDNRTKELLEFYTYGSFVKDISTRSFGKEIQLECIFNPHAENIAFQIILEECKDIVWQIFVESFEPPGSESPFGADVIGLTVGDVDYKSKFVLHTDRFEISVLYKNIRVEQESEVS